MINVCVNVHVLVVLSVPPEEVSATQGDGNIGDCEID